MGEAETVRPLARVVRESWGIHYVHYYGLAGSALVDHLANRASPSEPALAGTVVAFTSMKARNASLGWTVLACIDFGQYGTIFGRVVARKPWTAGTVKSEMRIGRRVTPSASGPEVRSLADIDFLVVQ